MLTPDPSSRRDRLTVALFSLRPDERRDAWTAFVTLFGLIGSHAILETARDTLFLSRVPTRHLPWVSLSIALSSFVVARAQTSLASRFTPRAALSFSTALAASVTFAFARLLTLLGDAGVYALYVWSGILTTLLLVWLWTLLAGLFSVTQAKRLYGFVGAGSVLGAIVGSGVAGALARVIAPSGLLVVAAAGFALTAALPFLFRKTVPPTNEPAVLVRAEKAGLAETLAYVRGSPYARGLLALLLVSTICLSLADYVFKSHVARLVPPAELGAFLGTFYFALNLASLIVQVGLVGRLLGRVSVGAALAVLPTLLVVGGVGVAATGGLLAVLVCKGADGALRYSLHRTASELLYFPFEGGARHRLKALLDVIGQRGGQVVASLGLLALTLVPGASPRLAACALVAAAAIWVVTALRLRTPYIALFRERLRHGRAHRFDAFPELDVASLETLVATLDSDDDQLVLAALHVLERDEKAHLVPALILYHPSEAVVAQALVLFTRGERTAVVPVLDRILDHVSPRIRCLAVAARSVLAHDRASLVARLERETSEEVRTAIVVQLIAAGDIAGEEARVRIAEIVEGGRPETKIALLEAVAGRAADGFDEVLVALARDEAREVRRGAIAAMGRLVRPTFVPSLIVCLGEEATRAQALTALANHGDLALAGLREALMSTDDGSVLRWRIPHALSVLPPHAAAEVLLRWLPHEPEGSVRFQMIRALERLVRRSPDLPLDQPALVAATDQAVRRAYASLAARVALQRHGSAAPMTGRELLCVMLEHKEKNAIDRLFRLLGLAFPGEDFPSIHRGLRGTKDQRAVSRELIESLLGEPLRSAVRGLVDDVDDDERLQRGGAYHAPLALSNEALLEHLAGGDSQALREVARFHLAEVRRGSSNGDLAPQEQA